METVRQGLRQLAERHELKDEGKHPLDVVAQDWSEHAGKTYTGKLLRKAQKISRAMWEFTATLQTVNPEQHERDCESL